MSAPGRYDDEISETLFYAPGDNVVLFSKPLRKSHPNWHDYYA